MSTKTRGRKRMNKANKLSNMYSFSVRLDNSSALKLDSMIQKSGMKRATYLREVILNHLDNDSSSTNNSNVDIDQVLDTVKILYNANITVK